MHRANNLRLVYFTEEEIKEMQDEIFFPVGGLHRYSKKSSDMVV